MIYVGDLKDKYNSTIIKKIFNVFDNYKNIYIKKRI